ncbi:hypothetical protein [Nocardiopsis lambiniae]|uniref:WXG100 family type VII secretion target n=1 Tax=Nocardiopsis lambiniae TaxID=3075539 RepID=A0ABU2MGS8_9ACTN|nr:hypothetical protein [Nocardiopsis sp. DSM 44743]MDT0331451.1 hypothetical protein [Nocardiopsis sp. DSM 44743]
MSVAGVNLPEAIAGSRSAEEMAETMSGLSGPLFEAFSDLVHGAWEIESALYDFEAEASRQIKTAAANANALAENTGGAAGEIGQTDRTAGDDFASTTAVPSLEINFF